MRTKKMVILVIVMVVFTVVAQTQVSEAGLLDIFRGDDGEEVERLILATTTSTENSGLLEQLIPAFEEKYSYRVDVVAVGTGRALQHGRDGDADVLMVHAKPAELKFVENGYGVNRKEIMYNDFVILGPQNDPANIKGTTDALEAFRTIAEKEATFISRGDNSGTNKKELGIWEEAGIDPSGEWYQETGQGMGSSITIADQKDAYILSDRGTYIAFRDKIDLEIVSEGDEVFYNLYGVIAVNPDKHPDVNYEGAQAFIDYLVSEKAQKIIKDYKMDGERLFNPLKL